MFDQDTIKHHIERSIIGHLLTNEYARFSDMRPRSIDTNLFSYHLKLLVKAGYIDKVEDGYTLGIKGLVYVDRVSTDKMRLRTQPKIITMLLVQNADGDILLQKRAKQPYINSWTLPYGKLHIDDISILQAAKRESSEKLNYTPNKVRHVGDCYIIVGRNEIIESRTLAHVVRFETDTVTMNERLQWLEPTRLNKLKLAPAVEQIIARSFFNDVFFFEEFRVEAQ